MPIPPQSTPQPYAAPRRPSLRWHSSALRLTTIYVVVAVVWITVTDRLLRVLVDPASEQHAFWETAKGWGFVLGTAVMLLVLLRRHARVTTIQAAAVERWNRALRTLGACNDAVIRATTEEELLTDVCRQLVKVGGYDAAWVGVPGEGPDRPVRLVAGQGMELGELKGLPLSWGDEADGRGALGTAIRIGQIASFPDLASPAAASPWQRQLEARGFRSAVGIPLRHDGETVAAFAVYSRRPAAFEDEIRLLGHFGENLARGLAALRAREESRRMEVVLRESEDRYRRLAEHAPDIVYRYRFRPVRKMEFISPAVERIVGYTPADYAADPDLPFKIIHPADRHLVARDQPTGGASTMRCITKDGRLVWLEDRSVLVRDEHGEPVAVEGIARDVTDTRLLEEQLRQSQKLEAVGQLTGGIAHDFNNILSVVQANAELLADKLPPNRVDLRNDLDDLRAAVKRGTDLISKLLGFSRRTELRVKRLDLREVLRETGAMLRRVIPEHIELLISSEDADVPVEGEAGAIGQILVNLATNARDAMVDGGRLTITLRRVTLDAREAPTGFPAGDYARIVVQDTGVGMDPVTLARAFEPFFTTKPPGHGTGLGLPMAYGLVHQLGGHLSAESGVGRGSTFTILLPIAAAASTTAAEAGADADPAPRRGTETILLVEDEPLLRRTAQRTLEHLGYQVITAADGMAALEILHAKARAIDLVISDLVMPNLGGRGLYETLRAEGSGIRFLVTSGYAAGDMQAEPIDPSLPFIQKPWTMAELAERVRQVLDGPPPFTGPEQRQ